MFVVEVLPDSQTEVDEVVLAGDVIDEINGVSLRNAYNGQVSRKRLGSNAPQQHTITSYQSMLVSFLHARLFKEDIFFTDIEHEQCKCYNSRL